MRMCEMCNMEKEKKKYRRIAVSEASYWKLVELKFLLRCETWDALVDELYERERKRRVIF